MIGKEQVITIATSCVVAVIVGVGSSYVSTIVTLSSVKTELVYIKGDVTKFESIVDKVNRNSNNVNLVLDRMERANKRLDYLEMGPVQLLPRKEI